MPSSVEHVLARYPADCRPAHWESLGPAGGFSGAALWRLTTARGLLCLRRWPKEHPTAEQLTFIHGVLRHVDREGFRLVPAPLATTSGDSFVSHGDRLWELTPWLPGQADFHMRPTTERLQAALTALAQFHLAASTFPLPENDDIALQIRRERPPWRSETRERTLFGDSRNATEGVPYSGPSPGLAQRRDLLRELLSGGLEQLAASVLSGRWPQLAERGRRLFAQVALLGPPLLQDLSVSADTPVPQQPVLRDIWHDHVLFQGDQVSGLVDFGALRVETVAGDVARLMGSLIASDATAWQTGLTAYQAVRPLSPMELKLVPLFDRSTVLLSGLNWLRWICVEQREFADMPKILDRLDESLWRLAAVNPFVGAS